MTLPALKIGTLTFGSREKWVTKLGAFHVDQVVFPKGWPGKWLIVGILERDAKGPRSDPYQLKLINSGIRGARKTDLMIWVSEDQISLDPSPTMAPAESAISQVLGPQVRH